MSKKKSYMNKNNVVSEGFYKDFFKKLFKGKKGLQKDVHKLSKDLEKQVNIINTSQSKLEKAIEKQYGKKVKLQRTSVDDMVGRHR